MILITEFMDESAVAVLRKDHEVVHLPDLADRADELARLAEGARALIVRNRTQVTEELLDCAPRLECIGRLGVGLDNIDLAACKGRGVAVHPATGANDRSVAEYVITAAMMLLRRSFSASAAIIAGGWPRQDCAGNEIHGRTLGLVGFGSIGRLAAELARALGMEVIACDPHLPPDDDAWRLAGRRELADLLSEADAVSLHVPFTPATRNLIGARQLAAMKPGSVLINTSRGGTVDEDALVDAIKSGRILGAALDVFEFEPLGRERAARFAGVPNLLLTPHIAGVTVESNRRVSMLTAENVLAHLRNCD